MPIRTSYGDPVRHRGISRLIRDRSENRVDIRQVLLRDLDLTSVRHILDLGCGYGWLEEALSGPFERLVGIDLCEANAAAFLAQARPLAREALFLNRELTYALDLPSDSFDLVLAAYSLYFFPGVLPEVRRVLKAGGQFVAITHSERMLEEAEAVYRFDNLRQLIRRFSLENGAAALRRYFRDIRTIDYVNRLVFRREDAAALVEYIAFKGRFIAQDLAPEALGRALLAALAQQGGVTFNKDDRIFIARK